MGNEILNENEDKDQDKEPLDYQNDYIRYGVISKKCGEKALEDNYLLQPNLEVQDTPKQANFSLFGVFDGHNSDYISKYLSDNIQKLYEKEIGIMDKNNYKSKIEEIFKTMDKELKEEEEKKNESKGETNSETKEQENNENENENKILENLNEIRDDNNENISEVDIGIDEKEVNKIKEAIKNSKDIPDDCKEIDDDEIKNLILFKNLFKYNNNYLYSDNDMNYIGSSASVVLINDNSVITADLGTTKAILFNKDGNILNSKDYRNSKNFLDHTFNNLEEKKRIKKFNKNIDYHNLKLNFYVPASRSFGFFKFKDNQILKEENQIISCVPDVYIYDKNNVDFILLITRGGAPAGDSLKKLLEKIKNIPDPENIKLTELIKEYINNKKEEIEKIKNKSINNSSTQTNKPTPKFNNSIYVGKEDFGEENVIITELNNTYYKDILSLNKNNDCNGDYNTTCILIQLLKDKKSNITPTLDGDTKNEEKIENENSKKDETNKEDKNEIKDNISNEIKSQNDETKIKEETKKEEDKKE